MLELLSALLLCASAPLSFDNPPDAPTITEPELDGQLVQAADVHMETAPFSDPDAGDTHAASDWEIWSASMSERVWSALFVTDLGKVHIHLADGSFEGSLSGATELAYDASYRLRARHYDQTGLASAWSERLFQTGPLSEVFPLELEDVADLPAPRWVEDSGTEIVLPAAGAEVGSLRVEGAAGELLLAIEGYDGLSNSFQNPPALAGHVDVRLVITGGSSPLIAVPSRLELTDAHGEDLRLYLPSFDLAPGESLYLWVAENSSTYYGDATQTAPDFSNLARSAPVPWIAVRPGYTVDVVASGFRLPVNIAFVPNPGSAPGDPLYYVSELYGAIQVVTNDGHVSPYATGLLNYDPGGAFPGSGEQGLSGLVVEPGSGDVIAAMLYDAGGPHYPKVVRYTSLDGGLTAGIETLLLDMVGESQGQSHFISNLSFGPDGRLYVHMGDGFDSSTAQNLDSFRGKILRLEPDGSAAADNPFYDAGNGITARDYVWCYGLRNPFGGAWRALDQRHYEVENGPSRDRMAVVEAGLNLGWNGSNASMQNQAIYNWFPAHAPVNIAFLDASPFGDAGFPAEMLHRALVSESGPTYAKGKTALGKRIVDFELATDGSVVSGPNTLIEYVGNGRATAVGLAVGPDGLYFTDLYKDQVVGSQPTAAGSNVLRVRWVGSADFSATPRSGSLPLEVAFQDQSDVPGASQWRWIFGDGSESLEHEPTHTYQSVGIYDVRLDVGGSAGVASTTKRAYVFAGDPGFGLMAEYYGTRDLSGPRLVREDPRIDFIWAFDAPDPSLPVDDFSARWTGKVLPSYGESYTFHLGHDDGARLWIDDVLVIDAWYEGSPYQSQGTIGLQGGVLHDIRLEYFDSTDFAYLKLEWESASEPRAVVPTERLYPAQYADFGISPRQGRAPLTVQFEDRSVITGATAWSWDFGDGTGSSLPDPTHVYAQRGIYDVTLSVQTSDASFTRTKPKAVLVGVSTPGGFGSQLQQGGSTGGRE